MQNPPPFVRARVIANLGGDEQLFKRIADIFLSEWPQRESNLRDALALGNAERLRAVAHEIKGAVGNFAAERAVDSARGVETACQNGDLSAAAGAVQALVADIGEVIGALQSESD